ncbi:hypothetical protein [Aquamicrobium ahrensii]|uniref:Chromosome condensin MukBEF ATPase and DNA-binding subunit MukB n=1 Tax=Aquamicrobium ahrensii TaxID=469551 RepID=A0ABV2KL96_9HYPH
MTQTFDSLKSAAARIKRQNKVKHYKEQVAALNAALTKQKEKVRAEEARAEYAERQVRQIAAERDIWKHQAQEAQAKLKSLGRDT